MQDYLLVKESIPAIAALADAVHKAFGPTRDLPALKKELPFERLMQSVSQDAVEPPAELAQLFASVPGEICTRALDMLAAGAKGARRKALVAVIERCAAQHAQLLIPKLRGVSPELANHLFGVLAAVAPDRSIDAAFELLDHPDAGFQLQLVELIGKSGAGLRLVRGLQHLMGSKHERVRVSAAAKLAERGGARAVPLLVDHLRKMASMGISDTEAAALGRGMASAAPDEAARMFAQWAAAGKGLRGVLSRLAKQSSEERAMLWAAVCGVELCPGEANDKLLESIFAQTSGDLKALCNKVIERRRGGGSRG